MTSEDFYKSFCEEKARFEIETGKQPEHVYLGWQQQEACEILVSYGGKFVIRKDLSEPFPLEGSWLCSVLLHAVNLSDHLRMS